MWCFTSCFTPSDVQPFSFCFCGGRPYRPASAAFNTPRLLVVPPTPCPSVHHHWHRRPPSRLGQGPMDMPVAGLTCPLAGRCRIGTRSPTRTQGISLSGRSERPVRVQPESATQHWRYSHAEQGSQCTPSPTIDYRQCHVTINCFDVATHLMRLPVRIGNPNLQTRRVTNLRNGTFLHLDRLCRRA